MKKITREEALAYHTGKRHGKTEVVPTKPCDTQRDLSMAYTPGVAEPCLEIAKDPELAFEYTNKGNLVAVVSNGTAVLGLGNIGPLAGKPVMEGKGVLFKQFADIDVFDIELDTADPKEIIRFCQLLEPTLGGINLEDIKAPECFEIEEELKKTCGIPVFHDDQHGTAIISSAGLLNALEVVGKKIDEIKVVVNGRRLDLPRPARILPDGNLIVPAAVMFTAMGATLEYTPETGVLEVTRGDVHLRLVKGAEVFAAGEREMKMKEKPVIEDGTMMISPRGPVEALGGSLQWNREENTLYVDSSGDDNSDAATDPHRMKISGSIRKYSPFS